MFISSFMTDIGRLSLIETVGFISHLFFDKEFPLPCAQEKKTPLLAEGEAQLKAYLEGRLRAFCLPLAPDGTAFMKRVWQGLMEIPYGQTTHYGAIAAKIGSPGASRAVGLANNKNPIPLIIPCHRVIGKNGSLTGYRGGLQLKETLLALESREGFRKI